MATTPKKGKAPTAKKATARTAGRPTIFTPELLTKICERLEEGVPMAAICRAEGMPNARTVRIWMEENAEINSAIARAREIGEDVLAAECLEIANTPVLGVIEKLGCDEKGDLFVVERRQEDMLGHRKLQIETRLKLLAKFNPKRWGDRQHIEHDVSDNLADQLKAARERASER